MTGTVTFLTVLLGYLVSSWGLPPPLMSGAEIEVLEARLDAEIEENRTRRCLRPVLYGEPRSGAAAHDMVLVAEGGEGLRDCYQFIARFGEVLFGAPGTGGEQQTGLVNQFVEICSPLPEALRRATAHEDACSPYIPGRRGLPDLQHLMGVFAAARQLAALTVLADRSETAAQRFLDILRFLQDLGRGGTPLVLAMQTTSIMREVLLNDLQQLVARPEIHEDVLQHIGDALDQLIDAEPSLPRIIAADTIWLALEAGLPMLRGPGWAPEGGFSHGRMMFPDDYAPALLPWIPSSQERGIIFAAFMDLDRRRREACPLGASLRSCHAGLRALSESREARGITPTWVRWVRVIAAPHSLEALRRDLMERIQAMVDRPFEGYVLRFANRAFHMVVLRFLVEIHLEIRRRGQCPAQKELDELRWKKILRDPVFGGVLEIRKKDPESYIIKNNGQFSLDEDSVQSLSISLEVPECRGK